MKLNPCYAYLNYLLKQSLSEETIERRTSREGTDYFLIPLQLPQRMFEIKTLGMVQVLENHLSCFENLTEASYLSPIHYTAILNQDEKNIKIHIYLSAHGDISGIYAKDLQAEEVLICLTAEDVWELFLTIKSKVLDIQEETYQTQLILERQYQSALRSFDEVFFSESLDDFRYISILEELLIPLESLKYFHRHYKKKYQRFHETIELTKQTQLEPVTTSHLQAVEVEDEKSDPLPSEVLVHSVGELTATPAPVKLLKSALQLRNIQEYLIILQTVLGQTPEKLVKSSSNQLSINPHFQAKLYDLTDLYHQINSAFFNMDDLSKTFKIQYKLMQAQLEFESCITKISHFCMESFEAMVLTNQLQAYDCLANLIEKPKTAILIHLIKNQAVEVLIDVLKRHRFSLFEPIFSHGTQNIFEYVIAGNKRAVFDSLIENFTIDFLHPIADGRPLACLILDLLPSHPMRFKCFNEIPQFNSKSFFAELKSKIKPLLLTHPNIINIYQVLDILKDSAGGALDSPRVNATLMRPHQNFFASLSPHLEEMSFLKKPHFACLLSEYERLGAQQKKRYEAKRKSNERHQARKEFLGEFCTDSMQERLQRIMPDIDEESAYLAMQLALEVAKSNDRVLLIEEELQKTRGLSIKQRKALIEEKSQLIDMIRSMQTASISVPSRDETRVQMASMATEMVYSSMPFAEKMSTALLFSQETEEKPLSYYYALPGLTAEHHDCITSIRANMVKYCSYFQLADLEQIIAALEHLDTILDKKELAEETLDALNLFYVHETKKLTR